jgi:Sec-independent protein secretion pathway component TatC
MAASPFLSPYLAYHSWVSVLAGLLKHDFELVLAVIGMWLVAVIRILGYG